LVCEDTVAIADGVEVYNPAELRIGSHAILSQGSYICGATHDIDNPDFPTIARTSSIGPYAWVCARAAVMPGVNLEEGAVLALGGVATRDIPAWEVHAGVPAKRIRVRTRR
jgi:putative colanic acid biosynthesis acetyltransferase WcaF